MTPIDDLLQELEEDKRKYEDLARMPSITGRFGVIALRARIREVERLSHRLQAMRLADHE